MMPEKEKRVKISQARFIVISGLIGAGKTTFTTDLAKHLGFEALYEPVEDNCYLADFYKDPKTWAYPMQEFLKSRRFALYQFAAWGIRAGRFEGVVLDRSIHEDTVFASLNKDLGNIHPRNWDTYLAGFQDMQHFLPEPDLYVFLDAPPDVCRLRALQRNRPEEAATALGDEEGIPLSYMQRLSVGYEEWLKAIAHRVPIVRLGWTEFQDTAGAWNEISSQVEERSRFTRALLLPRPEQ
jgi:deoxyadenosine/deoxycytidine kinase